MLVPLKVLNGLVIFLLQSLIHFLYELVLQFSSFQLLVEVLLLLNLLFFDFGFGFINGGILAVGSRFNDDAGADAGHVRVFDLFSI